MSLHTLSVLYTYAHKSAINCYYPEPVLNDEYYITKILAFRQLFQPIYNETTRILKTDLNSTRSCRRSSNLFYQLRKKTFNFQLQDWEVKKRNFKNKARLMFLCRHPNYELLVIQIRFQNSNSVITSIELIGRVRSENSATTQSPKYISIFY